MRTNNNAARKLRPVSPPVDLAPPERHRSALAGFILCALTVTYWADLLMSSAI